MSCTSPRRRRPAPRVTTRPSSARTSVSSDPADLETGAPLHTGSSTSLPTRRRGRMSRRRSQGSRKAHPRPRFPCPFTRRRRKALAATPPLTTVPRLLRPPTSLLATSNRATSIQDMGPLRPSRSASTPGAAQTQARRGTHRVTQATRCSRTPSKPLGLTPKLTSKLTSKLTTKLIIKLNHHYYGAEVRDPLPEPSVRGAPL